MVSFRTAYFARVGDTATAGDSLATLRAIVAAHNRSIPFENLDPLTGVPVADLSVESLTDKLVHRRRGGYCYEHNGLLGYVLEDMGFSVQRLAGRVGWMREGHSDEPPPQTHQVLAVTLPDGTGPYLVDVGFGGQTLTSPIRLQSGAEQQTRHEPYRLLDHSEGYLLQALIRGEWQPLYTLSLEPRPRIDLEVGSWYVSTHPASGFVVGLSAALVTDGERWNLRGRNLAVHRPGGTTRTRFDTADEVLEVLSRRFGIDLSDLGDRAALRARVDEVLDR